MLVAVLLDLVSMARSSPAKVGQRIYSVDRRTGRRGDKWWKEGGEGFDLLIMKSRGLLRRLG